MSKDDQVSIGILFGLTAISFLSGYCIRRLESAVKAWPQLSGTIVTSRIKAIQLDAYRKEVVPVIEYEFAHEGQTIKTSHWRLFNFSLGSREDAETFVRRYPEGKVVSVFVNKKNPFKSALETKPSALGWVAFAFGILFMVSGCAATLSVVLHK